MKNEQTQSGWTELSAGEIAPWVAEAGTIGVMTRQGPFDIPTRFKRVADKHTVQYLFEYLDGDGLEPTTVIRPEPGLEIGVGKHTKRVFHVVFDVSRLKPQQRKQAFERVSELAASRFDPVKKALGDQYGIDAITETR